MFYAPLAIPVALFAAHPVRSICNSTYPVVACAAHIRPYSDNAYTWGTICEVTAPSNVLIGEDVEMYDYTAGEINFDAGCDEAAGYYATCCKSSASCALYVDCDGPETALPASQATSQDLGNGWTVAYTCAVDNAERVLANTIVSYQAGTANPYYCSESCASQGYQYAGLEYGDECYCGTGYTGGVLPEAADPSECNMPCAGSYYWYCGGSWRMQIYKAPGAP